MNETRSWDSWWQSPNLVSSARCYASHEINLSEPKRPCLQAWKMLSGTQERQIRVMGSWGDGDRPRGFRMPPSMQRLVFPPHRDITNFTTLTSAFDGAPSRMDRERVHQPPGALPLWGASGWPSPGPDVESDTTHPSPIPRHHPVVPAPVSRASLIKPTAAPTVAGPEPAETKWKSTGNVRITI